MARSKKQPTDGEPNAGVGVTFSVTVTNEEAAAFRKVAARYNFTVEQWLAEEGKALARTVGALARQETVKPEKERKKSDIKRGSAHPPHSSL